VALCTLANAAGDVFCASGHVIRTFPYHLVLDVRRGLLSLLGSDWSLFPSFLFLGSHLHALQD